MAQISYRKYIKNLFFVKRRPQTHIAMEWEKPRDEEKYHESLEWEGLISYKRWKDDDLTQYPLLMQDLKDLDQHLLPVFWEFNQKAKHFQNRFYLYQWVFMMGAFITTVFGAATTFVYTLPNDGGVLPEIFGMMTAVIAFLTATFNVMSTQGAPQARWARSRRLTEELRMTYFKYLSHIEPFHSEDRVQVLRQTVLAIRRKENENV